MPEENVAPVTAISDIWRIVIFEVGLEVVIDSLVVTLNVPPMATTPDPSVEATADPPAVVITLFALIAVANLSALAFSCSDVAGLEMAPNAPETPPPIKVTAKLSPLAADATDSSLYVSPDPTVTPKAEVGLKLFTNVTAINSSLTVALNTVGLPVTGTAKSRPWSTDWALCVNFGSTGENLSDPEEKLDATPNPNKDALSSNIGTGAAPVKLPPIADRVILCPKRTSEPSKTA